MVISNGGFYKFKKYWKVRRLIYFFLIINGEYIELIYKLEVKIKSFSSFRKTEILNSHHHNL